MSETLDDFIASDSCPELMRARVEALRKFLAERNIDASVDDVVSCDDGMDSQLTLRVTLDFEWRGP